MEQINSQDSAKIVNFVARIEPLEYVNVAHQAFNARYGNPADWTPYSELLTEFGLDPSDPAQASLIYAEAKRAAAAEILAAEGRLAQAGVAVTWGHDGDFSARK